MMSINTLSADACITHTRRAAEAYITEPVELLWIAAAAAVTLLRETLTPTILGQRAYYKASETAD